jgi:hypothetical protein
MRSTGFVRCFRSWGTDRLVPEGAPVAAPKRGKTDRLPLVAALKRAGREPAPLLLKAQEAERRVHGWLCTADVSRECDGGR